MKDLKAGNLLLKVSKLQMCSAKVLEVAYFSVSGLNAVDLFVKVAGMVLKQAIMNNFGLYFLVTVLFNFMHKKGKVWG